MGSKSEQNNQPEETPILVSEDRIEGKIDRDLQDSFPASDPPGWTSGVERPSAKKEEKNDSSSSDATDVDLNS